MAFFSKLKERLFRSSSKLEEGLEAIVADGGQLGAEDQNSAAPAEAQQSPTPADQRGAVPQADVTPVQAQPSPAQTQASPEPTALPDLAPPAAQLEPLSSAEPARSSEHARPSEHARAAEPARPSEQVRPAEALRPAGTVEPDRPLAQSPVLNATPALSSSQTTSMAASGPLASPASDEGTRKPGLLGRLFGRESAEPVLRRELDDAMLESLEELLIASDMGVDTAMRVTANLAEGRLGKKLSVAEIKELLASEIARILEPVARPMPLYPKKPQVVLVVGVNGSGKTTTIGKLASQFRAAGKTVVIAAGDTFRAAAVEQLKVWGERAGVPVLTAPQGSDPASLAWDAMTKAQEEGADLLMIDTAGRLQNRADLMEELAKIVRVIRKKDPDAPHNTLLVLDATTGQNALSQVETFRKLADVSGLVMTKLDGTAKGGVLVALADKFGLPIHAIGVGEQIEDLDAFDPQEFARALVGVSAG